MNTPPDLLPKLRLTNQFMTSLGGNVPRGQGVHAEAPKARQPFTALDQAVMDAVRGDEREYYGGSEGRALVIRRPDHLAQLRAEMHPSEPEVDGEKAIPFAGYALPKVAQRISREFKSTGGTGAVELAPTIPEPRWFTWPGRRPVF